MCQTWQCRGLSDLQSPARVMGSPPCLMAATSAVWWCCHVLRIDTTRNSFWCLRQVHSELAMTPKCLSTRRNLVAVAPVNNILADRKMLPTGISRKYGWLVYNDAQWQWRQLTIRINMDPCLEICLLFYKMASMTSQTKPIQPATPSILPSPPFNQAQTDNYTA